MKKCIFILILLISFVSHNKGQNKDYTQVQDNATRLTYYTGNDDISKTMNMAFYESLSIDSIRNKVNTLCLNMGSVDMDTIPNELRLFNNVESIELEWKSGTTNIHGFHFFPKLKSLSLFESNMRILPSDTIWLKNIEIIDISKGSSIVGLNTFLWTPNLVQLYIEYGELSCPYPKDINTLKRIEIIRSGPGYSFIENISNVDFSLLANLKELSIKTLDRKVTGIPKNIFSSKNLKILEILHPNLFLEEKEELNKFRNN